MVAMPAIPWNKIKREYLSDETATHRGLAKKYGISTTSISKRAIKDKWTEQKSKILAQVSESLPATIASQVEEANKRHLEAAKLLQSKGLKALKSGAVQVTHARDAREFIVDGIALERKAMGLDNQAKNQQGVNVNLTMSITDLADKIKARTETPPKQ